MGAYSNGGLKIFLVVRHIPVEISLLVNYFFDPTHTSTRIRMFVKRTGRFSLINGCLFDGAY